MSSAGIAALSRSHKQGHTQGKLSTETHVAARTPQSQPDSEREKIIQARKKEILKMKEQTEKDNRTLRVFSWNICWGCMASDETSENDTTARTLAIKCAEEKAAGRDTCLGNVCKLIDSFPILDIVGLQEATRIPDLQEKSERLKAMKSVVFSIRNKESIVQIATFYNQNKFRLIGAVCGNLDPTGKDARPYQIILFNYTLDGKEVLLIVINLHNGKQYNNITKQRTPGFSKEEIEKTLSNCLIDPNESKMVMGYLPNNGNIMATLGETKPDNLYDQFKGINIVQSIALGDFNDNAHKYTDSVTGKPFIQDKFFKGFSPFGFKLIGDSNPENTCCVGETKLPNEDMSGHNYQGDYILASIGENHCLSFKKPPSPVPGQAILSSDHRAVYGELQLSIPKSEWKEAPEETEEKQSKSKQSFLSKINIFGTTPKPTATKPTTTEPKPTKPKSKTFLGFKISGGGNMNEMIEQEEYYKRKYLIYKRKYLELKNKK